MTRPHIADYFSLFSSERRTFHRSLKRRLRCEKVTGCGKRLQTPLPPLIPKLDSEGQLIGYPSMTEQNGNAVKQGKPWYLRQRRKI